MGLKAGHFPGHGDELGRLSREDAVGPLLPNDRPVRRHAYDPQLVDPAQLATVLYRRTGHAGQFLIEPEVTLVGDLGGVLGLDGDGHALLGFDRLVQTVAPLPVRHPPAGAFVDDLHLVVVGQVVLVPAKPVVGVQRRSTCWCSFSIGGACGPAGGSDQRTWCRPCGVNCTCWLFSSPVEVAAAEQDLGQAVGPAIDRLLLGRSRPGAAADDQRRAGLVDENVVGLVDQRKVMPPLDEHISRLDRHVMGRPGGQQPRLSLDGAADFQLVAQEVEAEARRRPVGDVVGISRCRSASSIAVSRMPTDKPKAAKTGAVQRPSRPAR